MDTPSTASVLVAAIVLLADEVNALVEQNRGMGVWRECLLQTLRERNG